jgi:drug/metabolite transporter (DMT)-like permease
MYVLEDISKITKQLILKEPFTPKTLAGATFILVGMIILIWK